MAGSQSVENVAHNNGRGLQIAALFRGVVLPRDHKIFDVSAIDLGEGGVVILRSLATIDRPGALWSGRRWPCAVSRYAP
jgi:hypothetical protein